MGQPPERGPESAARLTSPVILLQPLGSTSFHLDAEATEPSHLPKQLSTSNSSES